jgi:hypothetical protein
MSTGRLPPCLQQNARLIADEQINLQLVDFFDAAQKHLVADNDDLRKEKCI